MCLPGWLPFLATYAARQGCPGVAAVPLPCGVFCTPNTCRGARPCSAPSWTPADCRPCWHACTAPRAMPAQRALAAMQRRSSRRYGAACSRAKSSPKQRQRRWAKTHRAPPPCGGRRCRRLWQLGRRPPRQPPRAAQAAHCRPHGPAARGASREATATTTTPAAAARRRCTAPAACSAVSRRSAGAWVLMRSCPSAAVTARTITPTPMAAARGAREWPA